MRREPSETPQIRRDARGAIDVDSYVRRGRRLQAEAIVNIVREGSRFFRRH